MSNIIRLYHGSKSGIQGDIKPKSREVCDFGKGFYLGDKPDQPKGLIADRSDGVFYEIDYGIDNLNIRDFGKSYTEKLDWALFIAYNRRPELFEAYENLRARYSIYNCTYDLIIGYIADDSMMATLTDFFNGESTDKEMLACLSHVKLGKQYVLKTNKACDKDRFNIITSRKLTKDEITRAKNQVAYRQRTVSSALSEYRRMFRRDKTAKFIDEIMEEWNG